MTEKPKSKKHPKLTDSKTVDEENIEVLESNSISEVVVSQTFQGPLPPPEMLEKYEKILAGSAERVFVLAENTLAIATKEQEIREAHGNKYLRNDMCRIICSTLVSICLVAVGALCIVTGYEISGVFITVFGSLAGLIKFFFAQKNRELAKDELE